jgi:two-component system OmpR family sensor kinase
VIAATTALLDSSDPASDSGRELLKIADEEAHRLQVLIDDTVEMARLDTPEIRILTEPANVAELAREVVASMRGEIEDRPVQVISNAGAPPIPVDRRLLKLALKQLLDNAVKYSPPGSPVTVGVSDSDGETTVEVTDRGKGIPQQEQKRVFERMYRGPSTARQIPGSGLGLSIALNIARAHHGDLKFSSRPGETVFRLTLPAAAKGEAQ